MEAEFEWVYPTFLIEHGVTMESGSHNLLRSCVRKHVACKLFDGELIERFFGIERLDDIVAVGPDGPVAVFFVPVSVSIAGEVKPPSGPAFAIARGL